MTDEITRLKLENINLKRTVGEQTAIIEKLNAMLLVAQKAARREIEQEAAAAIQKARAK